MTTRNVHRSTNSLLIVLLLAFGLWQPTQAEANEPVELRVLSYNIHHCAGVDGKLDVERIAGIINSVKPDIVALQEVDVSTTRSKGVHQAKELAKLTQMKFRFEKNISFGGGEYGNCILSKFEILESKNMALPNIDSGEQRGALFTKLKINKDKEILFCATHLDHRRNPKERIESADELVKLAGTTKVPMILAGDLNATINSEPLKVFEKAFTIPAVKGKRFNTVPVSKPSRQIDFVLVDKRHSWITKSIQVLDEKVASDHRPIFYVFELEESKK